MRNQHPLEAVFEELRRRISVAAASPAYVGSRDGDQPDPQRHSKAWTIACAETNAAVAEANAVLQVNEADHLFVASFRGEQAGQAARCAQRSSDVANRLFPQALLFGRGVS